MPGTDPVKAQKNDQTFSMFNGRLDNDAVRVNPGDLVRMYFVRKESIPLSITTSWHSFRTVFPFLLPQETSRQWRIKIASYGTSRKTVGSLSTLFPVRNHSRPVRCLNLAALLLRRDSRLLGTRARLCSDRWAFVRVHH